MQLSINKQQVIHKDYIRSNTPLRFKDIVLAEYDRIVLRSEEPDRAFAHSKSLITKLIEYDDTRSGLKY